ncbi:MAG: SRPBCC family protein [Acidimicrobiia bacterium]
MGGTDDGKTYRVERSITISAPVDQVFDWISDFHRWTDWSPWEGLDPNMQRRYGGTDFGVGATYEWEGSRKVGKGRMEIVDAAAPTRLGIKLDFIKPFKSQNDCRFVLGADGGTTNVTWTMTGPKTFATKLMSIFTSMDKVVGRDFEKGLSQLKAVAER